MKNKIYDKSHYDCILELYALDAYNSVEYILTNFCKVIFSKDNFSIQCLGQYCKVRDSDWYVIENIYGINSEEDLCEICCCNKKNSYFLPCKHWFACSECAIAIRVRGNGCPICRQRKIIYFILI
ncbi:MAG: hypothetical protein MJ252_10805 [archaeon]|nr:hypothetical protein [archaeon]